MIIKTFEIENLKIEISRHEVQRRTTNPNCRGGIYTGIDYRWHIDGEYDQSLGWSTKKTTQQILINQFIADLKYRNIIK